MADGPASKQLNDFAFELPFVALVVTLGGRLNEREARRLLAAVRRAGDQLAQGVQELRASAPTDIRQWEHAVARALAALQDQLLEPLLAAHPATTPRDLGGVDNSSQPILVRAVRTEDIDAVWRIHEQGNEDVAAEEPLLPYHMVVGSLQLFAQQVEEEMEDPSHHHVVAVAEGRCVGWAHGYLVTEPDGTSVGYVSAVYVERGARRRGAGSTLLAVVTDWLESQRVDRVQLMTPARSTARALWAKRGFRPFLETLVKEND